MNTDTKRQNMIEDVTFLLSCGVGEAAILESTGYTRNPSALKRRLERADRRDLIPRIFEWEASIEEQQHPDVVARKRKGVTNGKGHAPVLHPH